MQLSVDIAIVWLELQPDLLIAMRNQYSGSHNRNSTDTSQKYTRFHDCVLFTFPLPTPKRPSQADRNSCVCRLFMMANL